jgi:hypothetical protein
VSRARSLIETIKDIIYGEIIDQIFVTRNGSDFQRLDEGKWINGRFEKNIRLDQPTHRAGEGMQHAHVLGRKGREIVVVNVDGSASHGTKGRLHAKDADALRAAGYNIPRTNIIEWTLIGSASDIMLLTEMAR